MQCFQVQRNSHAKTFYRDSVTCALREEVGHDVKSHEKSECCTNCKGDHAAYSRSCPNWIREDEIRAVQITQNLPILKLANMLNSEPNMSMLHTVAR